jgi:hypothetical protein
MKRFLCTTKSRFILPRSGPGLPSGAPEGRTAMTGCRTSPSVITGYWLLPFCCGREAAGCCLLATALRQPVHDQIALIVACLGPSAFQAGGVGGVEVLDGNAVGAVGVQS